MKATGCVPVNSLEARKSTGHTVVRQPLHDENAKNEENENGTIEIATRYIIISLFDNQYC
jgi:hypothetical protein